MRHFLVIYKTMNLESPQEKFERWLNSSDPYVVLGLDPMRIRRMGKKAKTDYTFSYYRTAKYELDLLFPERNPRRLMLLQKALFGILKDFNN